HPSCAKMVLPGCAEKSKRRQTLKIAGLKMAQAYHSMAFHQRFLPQVIGKPRVCWWMESLVAKNRANNVARTATTPALRSALTELCSGFIRFRGSHAWKVPANLRGYAGRTSRRQGLLWPVR